MELLTPPDSAISIGYDRRRSLVSLDRSKSSSSPEHAGEENTRFTLVSRERHHDTDKTDSPTIAPKVEESEDGVGSLAVLEEAKPAVDKPVLLKKRGRPRKHPVTDSKKPITAHARSKTGCGTCRQRKKKCDETWPECINCQKNNVFCDGYQRKQHWRSGRQKALDQLNKGPMPPLKEAFVPGIEDPLDYNFLHHFNTFLGHKLSLKDEQDTNPFLKNIICMASGHKGLMHSLLFISSSSMAFNIPSVSLEMERRQAHHEDNAITTLKLDMEQMSKDPKFVADESVAQALLLCLQTVCTGNLTGAYAVHLKGMKTLLTRTTLSTRDNKFIHFVREFFVYHEYCSAITSQENTLDDDSIALLAQCTRSSIIDDCQNGTLVGVLDGLFDFIRRIRTLRDKVRKIRTPGFCILNDLEAFTEAWDIDKSLREWKCGYSTDSPRYLPSLLYRQCAHLYLQRTCWRSERCSTFKQEVDKGLEYLRMVPWDKDDSATQSILLMPLFLLGCAAFEHDQRPEIVQTFQRLEEWSNLRNIPHARAIVEEIWQMMDDGRADETWDWEALMAKKGWSFLVT